VTVQLRATREGDSIKTKHADMAQQSTVNENLSLDACYQVRPLLFFLNIYGVLAGAPAFEIPKE